MSLNNFLIGDSSNLSPAPPAWPNFNMPADKNAVAVRQENAAKFYVKILRGAVATYFAGDEDNHVEVSTQSEATDLKTLSEARVKSRVLLYDQAQNIDSTEVEIVL